MVRVIRILAALLILVPAAAGAQSLADVAKAEEARRKTVDKPSKVYTNTDLRSDTTAQTPPSSAPATSSPAAATSAAPAQSSAAGSKTAAKPEPPKPAERDETYWKGRMTAARDAVNRSKMFLDALQSRINALTTDFTNRDDPYQRAAIEQDRNKALAELERVKQDIDDQTKAIAAIEDEARKAGVPSGWLR
jgi:hypothetical protein